MHVPLINFHWLQVNRMRVLKNLVCLFVTQRVWNVNIELESVSLVGGGEESSGVTSREVGFADLKCHSKSCLGLILGVFGNNTSRRKVSFAKIWCTLPR